MQRLYRKQDKASFALSEWQSSLGLLAKRRSSVNQGAMSLGLLGDDLSHLSKGQSSFCQEALPLQQVKATLKIMALASILRKL